MNPLIKTACLEFERRLAAALESKTRAKLAADGPNFGAPFAPASAPGSAPTKPSARPVTSTPAAKPPQPAPAAVPTSASASTSAPKVTPAAPAPDYSKYYTAPTGEIFSAPLPAGMNFNQARNDATERTKAFNNSLVDSDSPDYKAFQAWGKKRQAPAQAAPVTQVNDMGAASNAALAAETPQQQSQRAAAAASALAASQANSGRNVRDPLPGEPGYDAFARAGARKSQARLLAPAATVAATQGP